MRKAMGVAPEVFSDVMKAHRRSTRESTSESTAFNRACEGALMIYGGIYVE